MRILITNNTLATRAGSELYVRDLAIGLLRRGHEPTAYSTKLGDVAQEIKAAGVPVLEDLNELTLEPDIIHGHHHLDTMVALLRCPETPAIYVCHGSIPWEEAAPRFPRILRYIGVDDACRDRMVLQDAIPPDRIQVILNFVDLERFKPRAPLPSRPRLALIFSNQANERTHLPAVRSACERAGIQLDVVGSGAGKSCAKPETVLGNYDIVFAKGRAALEALAVGTAVVLCDAAGVGPLVTSQNVAELRPLNFGIRALREPLSPDAIARAIAGYDPIDAANVAGIIRASAGRDGAIDALLSLYREVIDEHHRSPRPDVVSEQKAVADYLQELAPRLKAFGVQKVQLELIKNSRSWRLISRYVAIKHNLVLPSYNRISGLWRPAAAIESDPTND